MSQKRQVNARIAVKQTTLERFNQRFEGRNMTADEAVNYLLDIAALPTPRTEDALKADETLPTPMEPEYYEAETPA